MYQIKRNHVVENLELDDNGKKLNLRVDLNVDSILRRYLAVAGELTRAQRDINKGLTEERVEKLGQAIIDVFGVIFGDEQTKQLIDFYDGAYTEMLADVAPFINDVVAPKVNEAQQRLMQNYQNVKQRFKK